MLALLTGQTGPLDRLSTWDRRLDRARLRMARAAIAAHVLPPQ
jgi:hypothetical protein